MKFIKNHPLTIKITSSVVAILFVGGAVYFTQAWNFLPKQTVKQETQAAPKANIPVAPSANEMMENALYKRIDFINKLISDFNLNGGDAGKRIFYKEEDTYKEIVLSNLLSLDIKNLGTIKELIAKNGVYVQDMTGAYKKRELSPQTNIETTKDETTSQK